MFVHRRVTGSTNDDARAIALAGAPHGAVVLAGEQTAGRGRAGRTFTSPAGGFYMSIVLRPAAATDGWGILPLTVGAAVASALRERGFPLELKWPNDLMLAGGKVGGILVESRFGPAAFVVAGIGINIGTAPEGATSLHAHGTPPDAEELARAIRRGVLARITRLEKEGPRALIAEVRSLCGTLGRRVEWDEGEGVALEVDEDGALVVELQKGTTRIVAGDVRVRAR